MYLCIDIHYSAKGAVAAAVVFEDIDAGAVIKEYIGKTGPARAYTPGNFYKRELPAILALLRTVEYDLDAILIDGYVWLSADLRPGLGAHLYKALDEKTAVIGVAKSAFKGTPMATEVFRGRSTRPLYVTAAGMEQEQAAALVRNMHGPHRLPTLLKHVDRLARDYAG
ncbi:MAG: endonuclease V [Desulfobulbaceae bacterium]|nr:endonuclease V [Desulfobulbaceae bacterium]